MWWLRRRRHCRRASKTCATRARSSRTSMVGRRTKTSARSGAASTAGSCAKHSASTARFRRLLVKLTQFKSIRPARGVGGSAAPSSDPAISPQAQLHSVGVVASETITKSTHSSGSDQLAEQDRSQDDDMQPPPEPSSDSGSDTSTPVPKQLSPGEDQWREREWEEHPFRTGAGPLGGTRELVARGA